MKMDKDIMELRSKVKERHVKDLISEIRKYKRFERIAATAMYLIPVAAFAPCFLKSYRDWAFGQVDWIHSSVGAIIVSGIIGAGFLAFRYGTKLADKVNELNYTVKQDGKEVEVKNVGLYKYTALSAAIGRIKVVMRHDGIEEKIA